MANLRVLKGESASKTTNIMIIELTEGIAFSCYRRIFRDVIVYILFH